MPPPCSSRFVAAMSRCARAGAFWTEMFLLLVLVGFPVSAQVQRDAENSEGRFEVLIGCRLVTNQVVDGDSFHVTHKGREYYFRLYFVDAPERDFEFRDRVKDQAIFFGISETNILRAGDLASRFTRERLSGRDITIRTRWQNGLGRSRLARFYCEVYVDGANLAEELVANGWARIHGTRASLPDGQRSATVLSKLRSLELTAREKKRGIWNHIEFPLEIDPPLDGGTNSPPKSVATGSSASIDINSATYEDLKTLPGIGPKLAERIIAHRPFETLKDLDAVPGIGPAKLEQLRPLVRVNQSSASGGQSK